MHRVGTKMGTAIWSEPLPLRQSKIGTFAGLLGQGFFSVESQKYQQAPLYVRYLSVSVRPTPIDEIQKAC
jgi:hypothetical protein